MQCISPSWKYNLRPKTKFNDLICIEIHQRRSGRAVMIESHAADILMFIFFRPKKPGNAYWTYFRVFWKASHQGKLKPYSHGPSRERNKRNRLEASPLHTFFFLWTNTRDWEHRISAFLYVLRILKYYLHDSCSCVPLNLNTSSFSFCKLLLSYFSNLEIFLLTNNYAKKFK